MMNNNDTRCGVVGGQKRHNDDEDIPILRIPISMVPRTIHLPQTSLYTIQVKTIHKTCEATPKELCDAHHTHRGVSFFWQKNRNFF